MSEETWILRLDALEAAVQHDQLSVQKPEDGLHLTRWG